MPFPLLLLLPSLLALFQRFSPYFCPFFYYISFLKCTQVPLEVLQARLPEHLSDRGVVAPNHMTVRELFVQRRPLYEQYADMTIACNGDMEHVLNRLERGVAPFLNAAVLSR
mgnify:FL=1|jgi:hypothetical protein